MTNAASLKDLPVIRIFISSPGDVEEERRIVAEIVQKLQKSAHVHDRATLRAIRYDDPEKQIPLLYNMTMQEAVNQNLQKPSDCNIVLGILWARMGTPLDNPLKPDNTQYLSGTEWEIEDAINAGVDLLIYRRISAPTVAPSVLGDVAALEKIHTQFVRVEAFTNRLRNPAPGVRRAVHEYASVDKFRKIVEQHLAHAVQSFLDSRVDTRCGAAQDQKYERVVALKNEYAEILINETATIQLPIVAPSGRPVVATQSGLRIDLPLFINHDHSKLESQDGASYVSIAPVEVNDRFRLSHTDSIMVDRADRYDDECRECSIGQRLTSGMRAVVVGDPGSGKSTLVKWLSHHYASVQAGRTSPNQNELANFDWFPIAIACREFSGGPIPETLTELLKTHLRNRQFLPNAVDELAFELEQLLSNGNGILLIDGLDEIANIDNRERFSDCLISIANKFTRATIIATSRIVGFEALTERMASRFDYLIIGPLDRAAKARFVRLWGQLCKLKHKDILELTEKIVKSRITAKITDTVLMLAIVVQLQAAEGSLPDRRVDLFRRAIEIILKRQRSGSELSLHRNEVVPHLEYLAYKMRLRGSQRLADSEVISIFRELRQIESEETELRRRSPEDLLYACIHTIGLLNVAGKQVDQRGYDRTLIQFFHQSFQEYFAGQALLYGRGDLVGGSENIYSIRQLLINFEVTENEFSLFNRFRGTEPVFAERWQEVVRLLLADLPKGDVDIAFGALLPTAVMPRSEARARATFALQCLADDPAVSESAANQLFLAIIETVSEFDSVNRDVNTLMDQAVHAVRESRFADDMKKAFVNAFQIKRGDERLDVGRLAATALWCAHPLNRDEGTVIDLLESELCSSDPIRRCEMMLRLTELLYQCSEDDNKNIWPSVINNQRRIFGLVSKGLTSDDATRSATLWALAWLCRGRHRNQDAASLPLPLTLKKQIEDIILDNKVDLMNVTLGLYALSRSEGYTAPFRERDWAYDLAVVADGHAALRNFPRIKARVERVPIDNLCLPWSMYVRCLRGAALGFGSLGNFCPEMIPHLKRIAESAIYDQDSRFEAMMYMATIGTQEAIDALIALADTPEDVDDIAYSRGIFSLIYLDNVDVMASQILKNLAHSDIRAYAFGMAGSADPRGREILNVLSNHDELVIRLAAEQALQNAKLSSS